MFMKLCKFISQSKAIALVACMFGTATYADDGFRTTLDPGGALWDISTAYEQANLIIVTPDDEHSQLKFAEGETVVFNGPFPIDGLYKFEIVLTPKISDETRARMMEARRTGDKRIMRELRESGELPSGPMRYSGSFRVQDGGIVVAGEDTEEKAPLKLN